VPTLLLSLMVWYFKKGKGPMQASMEKFNTATNARLQLCRLFLIAALLRV